MSEVEAEHMCAATTRQTVSTQHKSHRQLQHLSEQATEHQLLNDFPDTIFRMNACEVSVWGGTYERMCCGCTGSLSISAGSSVLISLMKL